MRDRVDLKEVLTQSKALGDMGVDILRSLQTTQDKPKILSSDKWQNGILRVYGIDFCAC